MLTYFRVIELNVGTICACLPYFATFYRHHRLTENQVTAIKQFTYKISPFKSSRRSKTSNHRLGTDILGSVEGEGKFLKTADFSVTVVSSNASEEENTHIPQG